MNKNLVKSKLAVCFGEDQNAGVTFKIIKNNKELKCRAALGSLQNFTTERHALSNNICIVTSKELCRSKFQNIKAKVDTHWNKGNKVSKVGEAAAATSAFSKTIQEIIDQIINTAIKTAISHEKYIEKTISERVPSAKVTSNVQHKNVKRKINSKRTKTDTIKTGVKKKLSKSKLGVTSGYLMNIATRGAKVNTHKIDAKKKPIFNNNENLHREETTSVNNEMAIIRDIDEGYDNCTTSIKEYLNDIYSYLFDKEAKKPIQLNHMKNHLEINGNMRAILIDWINEMAFQFHLFIETFQLSVAIIDHYLDVVKNTKRSELQLVGTTALLLATKYEELCSPSTYEFAYITDNAYTVEQICQMEIKILKTLQYDLSWPLSIQFLRRFSKAADAENSHYNMAKYFIELITIESNMAHYKPSEIAAASLFLSLNLLKNHDTCTAGFKDAHWTPTLQYYTRYSVNHLKPISRRIAIVARNTPNGQLKAAYIKYQSHKYGKVSIRSELYGPLMDSIIVNCNDNKKDYKYCSKLKQN